MSAIGHPVLNDPRYGQRNVTALDRDRLALHAGRLSVTHPAEARTVDFVAPLPQDLVGLGISDAAEAWLAID